ncbi:hypothetical protein Tco_0153741 [Tanacetum coccineum]
MEQYLALTRGNQATGMVKPEIGGNANFEVKRSIHAGIEGGHLFRKQERHAHEHVERMGRQTSSRNHRFLPSSLKKSATSSKKETKHYTKLGNEASQETHDKIIQGLEGKVKTLTNKVERRANNKKFEECNTIYSENGLPLYTPFYYSPEEIEYFSANSGFSDNEEQETDDSGMAEAVAALEAILKKKREEPKKVKHDVNYYVYPYETPILFPKRLEHHAEEALVHQTMKNLKKIKINHPLSKEIRQTDNYAKQMKYLVENKPRTEDDNEIRMNPRCFALIQNHLPPKEQDPGSFILPCSNEKLDFKNALADLGASISIMPFSMYKRLGKGKLKPINMLIEMADNTKCAPNGIIKILLIKTDKFIFPDDFVILDMVEDIRMPIILGRPLLATIHAQVDIFRKTISLEVGSEKVIFKMGSSFTTTNFESVCSIKSKTFIEDDNLKEIDYDLFLYNSESCEFNRLLRIDPDIFSYEIDVRSIDFNVHIQSILYFLRFRISPESSGRVHVLFKYRVICAVTGQFLHQVEFFKGWKPLAPLQLVVEEVMSE